MRSHRILTSLCLLAFLGCAQSGDDDDDSSEAGGFQPLRHEDRLTAWVEFVEDDEAAARVAFASDNGLNLNLAMKQDEHDRDRLRAWCEAAEAGVVAIRLWPLVAEEDGYWANQANAQLYMDWALQLVEWSREDCSRLDGVAVDMEFPIERAFELQELMGEDGSVTDLVDFFMGGIDEDLFEQSRTIFDASAEQIQAEGLTCTVSTLAMAADDVLDGDETIAHALWTPIDEIGWDRVSFQVYRSLFDDQFSAALDDPEQRFTSGLVSSYADDIVAHFGDRASIDLGTTSGGISDHGGLESAAELQADLAASLASGIDVGATMIYSLEGTDDRDDTPSDWFAIPTPQSADPDAATEEIRALFATLDALGD